MRSRPEILAPAGSPESLLAAVRCGANAVYLGGKSFNARRNAANFDDDGLAQAVRYCHERGVKVYLTLNTLILDGELEAAGDAIKSVCECGVDAIITQDLCIAKIARECAPTLPLHASTQMSVHNAAGAKALEALGFTRVVLARELSNQEIIDIHESADIELECFVHGALCMSVSGRCYFSAMLGGRSGNRGLCAQPCRLPFKSQARENCLSLKDLSLIESIGDMAGAGIVSLKIEGRMKRPEYVAAAVTAVKNQLNGDSPDLESLKSVFSRDGFTDGYFYGKLGGSMFGTRNRDDVTAASPVLLNKLAASYKNEVPLIPVDFSLTLKSGEAARLTVSDDFGHKTAAKSEPPQTAITAPTTYEKAFAALAKTGGTPFLARDFAADIDEGIMLPASALNNLRRDALNELLRIRGDVKPHSFEENPKLFNFGRYSTKSRQIRVRVETAEQLCDEILEAAQLVIVPAQIFGSIGNGIIDRYADKIAIESPPMLFGRENANKLQAILEAARAKNITRTVAGGLDTVRLLTEAGFSTHGDFSLNITNTVALEEYARLGLTDATVSFELTKRQIENLGGALPRGVIAYGRLPLMLTRNCPVNPQGCFDKPEAPAIQIKNSDTSLLSYPPRKGCKNPEIIDRLGNKFPVRCGFGISEVLNCVPLVLSDKLGDFDSCDFLTLRFTTESPQECAEILRLYQSGGECSGQKTRGLYYRGID